MHLLQTFCLYRPSKGFCLSLDTETVNYDHYLRWGGALNFEFSFSSMLPENNGQISPVP